MSPWHGFQTRRLGLYQASNTSSILASNTRGNTYEVRMVLLVIMRASHARVVKALDSGSSQLFLIGEVVKTWIGKL